MTAQNPGKSSRINLGAKTSVAVVSGESRRGEKIATAVNGIKIRFSVPK